MKIKHLMESSDDTFNKFTNLIEADYSQAYQAFMKNDVIYKGMDRPYEKDFEELTPIINRKSRNTSNFYTLWMNNSEEWKDYPKRSVICTTNAEYAGGFGYLYILFPKNNSKIGVVNKEDIWNRFRNNLNNDSVSMLSIDIKDLLMAAIRYFNKTITIQNIEENYDVFVEAVHLFDSIPSTEKNEIMIDKIKGFNTMRLIKQAGGLYNLITNVFSPKGFSLTNISNFKTYTFHTEIWFDNKFLAMRPSFLRDYYYFINSNV